MADDFEYISKTRLVYKNGMRHAYLGDVPEPVVYGVQGESPGVSGASLWTIHRARGLTSSSRHDRRRQQARPARMECRAIVLAGGDGTRVRDLPRRIAGDGRTVLPAPGRGGPQVLFAEAAR